MSTQVLRNASDTWTNENQPSKNYGQGGKIQLDSAGSNQKFGWIYFATPFPRGATIISAKMYMYLGATLAGSQTLKAKRVLGSWSVNKITWKNQPSVGATEKTVTKSNPAANSEWVMDLTQLMQEVSDGGDWFGLRLTMAVTGSTTPWFHSTQGPNNYRPRLEITWSDAPEAPEDLFPNAGRVVKTPKPVLRCNFTDVSGNTQMSAINVQMNPTNSFTAPAFDSGWVLTSVPQLDLTTTGYAGLANGSTVYWRVRVRDGANLESPWSQPAFFSRQDQSTITPLVPSENPTIIATNQITNPAFRSQLAQVAAVNEDSVLAGIRTKLANANTTPVIIQCGPSDSVTEGAYVNDWRKSWVGQLVDLLAAKYSPGNYGQSCDLINTENAFNFPFTFSGTPVVNNTYGPGLQSMELDASGDQITVTVPAGVKYIQLWYRVVTDSSLGSLTYSFNGGATTVVNTGSRASAGEANTFLTLPGNTVTMEVAWSAGAKVIVTGFFFYWGDITKGVWISENAEGGRKASDYVANTNWSAQLDVADPHLIILPIGMNDYFHGDSSATIKANIQSIIATIKSKITDVNIPIILLPYWEPMQIGQTFPYDEMRKMYAEIGTADANVVTFDPFPKIFGPYDGTDHNGSISSDMIHPNEYGHSIIANTLFDFITGNYTRGSSLIRENLCTNPSFQLGTTGWSFAANDVLARTRGALYEWSGTHYEKITKPNTTGDVNLIAKYAFTAPQAGAYRMSIDVRAEVAPDVLPSISLANFTGATNIATVQAYPSGAFGAKYRIIYDFFIVAGDLTGDVEIRGHQPGTSQVWSVDGMVIERSTMADGTYFDGDTMDDKLNGYKYAWAGEPHASASRMYGDYPSTLAGNISGVGITRAWTQRSPEYGLKYRLSSSAAAWTNINSYLVPVVALSQYRLKARWKVEKGTGTPSFLVGWYNSSFGLISTTSGPLRSAGSTYEENISLTAPSGAVWAMVYQPYILVGESEGIIYQVMFTDATYNGPYFDGSSPLYSGIKYAWTGTADASTSVSSLGVYVSSTTPRVQWSFVGQVAYQVQVRDPSQANKVIYDTNKVTSTQQYVTIPKGVMTVEDQLYTVMIRCWDAYNRESTPGYPVYAENVRSVSYSRLNPLIPPVTTLSVSPTLPFPYNQLVWTRSRPADSFEIMRARVVDMKFSVIESGSPSNYVQTDGSFAYKDTTPPLREAVIYKVIPIETDQGSQLNNPTGTSTAQVIAPMLSELDGSDPVFLLNPERDMGFTDTSAVYQTVGDSPPVLITQEARTRRYSGQLTGLLVGDLLEGVTADEFAARFDRLSVGPGRTLRLTVINKQMKVFIVSPTYQPEAKNEGVRYRASFGFYQVD